MRITTKQRGAVSLFVVIFAALLITVVTVSFIRIMIQNQQQSTANDLSQSAYDSAQVGVEDAKRAILLLQSTCANVGDCTVMKLKIDSPTCNVAVLTLSDVQKQESGNEILVQTGDSSNRLNQAYTCVKISMNTDDYVGSLDKDALNIIPLVGVSDFNTIKIEWFNSNDLSGPTTNIDYPSSPGSTPLLSQDSWINNIPSIIRAQLIEFNSSSFNLNDFDSGSSTGNGSNNTLFLYPSTINSASGFTDNSRPTSTSSGLPGTPSQAKCSSNLISGGYACSATLTLPKPIVNTDHTAYLILKAFYRKTSYRITLYDGTGKQVQFNGVEPSVDSTGRADNLFRRVQSRVKFGIPFPYPQAAVETTGNLCKNFMVTNNATDFPNINPNLCTP